MTDVSKLWAEWKAVGQPPPYLLIDCAGLPNGHEGLPKHAFSKLECMFSGDLADELKDVAPYLGRFATYDADSEALATKFVQDQVGTLVLARSEEAAGTFDLIHKHFRRFNIVYGSEGRPLFFRYYDPRLLVDVLSVMSPRQVEAFFGPAQMFVAKDPLRSIVCCVRGAMGLNVL